LYNFEKLKLILFTEKVSDPMSLASMKQAKIAPG
jgi:hypothetical protein